MNASFSSSGKKDENRRTLTDFKIIGLEMRELGWNWGILPLPSPPTPLVKDEDASQSQDASVKREETEVEVLPPTADDEKKIGEVVASAEADNIAAGGSNAETGPAIESKPTNITTEVPIPTAKDAPATTAPSPPSRIRIYFHTPVSADDSHPISLNATSSFLGLGSSDSVSTTRKGKRKKLEEDDDDADMEGEGRGKRPPPMGSGVTGVGGGESQISDNTSVEIDAPGRGSVAPSVAETTSEADWLMAAIVQDEADGTQSGDGDDHVDRDGLNVSHVVEDANDTEVGEGDHNVTGKFTYYHYYYYPTLVWTKMPPRGRCNPAPTTPLTSFVFAFFLSQGNDLLVTDGHEHHAENLDGQEHDRAAQGSSGMESIGHVEAGGGPNAAAAVDTSGSKQLAAAVPPNGINASKDVTAAMHTEGAPVTAIADGDARPAAVSETLTTEPKDISGSPATATASNAPNDVISSSVATAPDPASEEEEHTTNGIVGYPDTQVPVPHLLVGGKPLQAEASLASTIPDDDAQVDEDTGSFDEDGGVTTAVNPDSSSISQDKSLVMGEVETQVDFSVLEQDHLPEPPASPTSNTLLSTSSGSTYGEPGSQNTSTSVSAPVSPVKVDGKATKTPSANRLSISYAAGSRRLVVDAGVVEKLKVFRSDGRIEVIVNIERDGEGGLKGVLVRYYSVPSSRRSSS